MTEQNEEGQSSFQKTFPYNSEAFKDIYCFRKPVCCVHLYKRLKHYKFQQLDTLDIFVVFIRYSEEPILSESSFNQSILYLPSAIPEIFWSIQTQLC